MKRMTSTNEVAPVALGTGLVALDLVYGAGKGERRYAGGTCGNVMAILAYLGWHSYPVARLRPGAAAEWIRRDLARFGVKLDFLARRRTGSTPIIVQRIESGPDGQPHHRFTWSCPSCGAMLPSYKAVLVDDAEAVAAVMPAPRIFFFDRVSRGALMLAEKSATAGAVVVFEPSGIGDPKLFGEAVRVAHVLKHSRERMIQMEGVEPGAGPRIEIETLGDEGLRYRSSLSGHAHRGWQRLPAYPVRRLRDTAGSGDWCTAGILSRLATDGRVGIDVAGEEQVRDAVRFGQALAAWNCEFEGARGGMYRATAEECRAAVAAIQSGEILDHRFAADDADDPFTAVCPWCRRPKVTKAASARRAVPAKRRVTTAIAGRTRPTRA
jgi:fructokinase